MKAWYEKRATFNLSLMLGLFLTFSIASLVAMLYELYEFGHWFLGLAGGLLIANLLSESEEKEG